MASAGNGARAHFARGRIVCCAPCTEFISTESFGRAARAGAKRSDDHRGIDIGNRLCGVCSHQYTLCILHVLAVNHQPMQTCIHMPCMCMAGAISLREMERTPGFGRLPMMVCSALPPGCIAAPAELMSGLELEHEDTGVPATCMAARIVTICAIYQKRNFYLSHLLQDYPASNALPQGPKLTL